MHAKVTVIVSPRERFEQAIMSLESLYETSGRPIDLIYVDGATPKEIAKSLQALVVAHGGQYVRRNKYLSPNQARNLAAPMIAADTAFVVFVDNDVLFTPGWLDMMIGCAHETGAGLVSPTILVGPEGKAPNLNIHHAGGALTIEMRPGQLARLTRSHHHEHRRYLDAQNDLRRQEIDCTEFHAVLLRKAVVDQILPFDENIIGFSDEIDMALLARKRGWKIWFEPTAIVTYATGKRLTARELPYFCLRWSAARCLGAERHFYRKWGFEPDFARQRRFLRDHRRHAFPFRGLQEHIGWRFTVALTSLVCEAVALAFAFRMTPINRAHLKSDEEDYGIVRAHVSVFDEAGGPEAFVPAVTAANDGAAAPGPKAPRQPRATALSILQ